MPPVMEDIEHIGAVALRTPQKRKKHRTHEQAVDVVDVPTVVSYCGYQAASDLEFSALLSRLRRSFFGDCS